MAAAKRTSVKALEGRIEGLEGILNGIASKLGVSDATPAPTPEAKPAKAQAKQTRTVKLPELQTFTDERRAMGVDGTYTSNIAIYKTREDGSLAEKKDGGVRKPTRLRVEDAEFILTHADDVRELCSTIRTLKGAESEQASA